MLNVLFRAVACLALAGVLVSGSTFSGVVTDAASGKPISGAMVTVETKITRADASGHFHIEGNGPAVNARAYGYGRVQVAATAQNGQSLNLKLSPITPHAVYLSFWGVGTPAIREPILKLADQGLINAVVIDVKGDMGYVSFPTEVSVAHDIGAQKIVTIPDAHGLLERLHKQGLYSIARIVTFKDDMLCKARPEWAVRRDAKVFKDREGLTWCDPFVAEVRRYNIDLAVAAAKAGFDEVEFDYVRFPDAKGVAFSEASTDESRPRTIDVFLTEARQKLVPYNVFLSADVFGYICWNKGDTGIGQKINDVTDILDYVSPMLYPSGFNFGIPNYRDPLTHPYEIVRLTLDRGGQRTKIDPVRFRPWLQAFADYAFDKRAFGEREVQAQIKAAQDFGSGGWLLWNPRNNYPAAELRGAAQQVAATRLASREQASAR